MKIRLGMVVVAAWLGLVAPSRGFAQQTCTIGPLTSSTSLSSVNTQINSAPGGAVICLARGSTWNASSGLSITPNHADASRVTICASDSSQCTASGAANPRIAISGNGSCVGFGPTAGGYNLRNLDCYNTSNPNSAVAFGVGAGKANITIEGGTIDGFWNAAYFDGGSTVWSTNIKFGTCANRIEIRNGPTTSPGGLRFATWGALTNSSMSVWIHDFTGFSTGGMDHMLDLAENGSSDPYHSTNNLTIECSLFQFSGGGQLGSMIKPARGTNLTIRDNTFQVTGSTCSNVYGIYFNDHAESAVEGWDGAEVYRNTFDTGSCNGAIADGVGRNIKIYNNIGIFTWGAFQRGLVQFWYNSGGPEDLQVGNVAIYNNTVYRTGQVPATGDYPLISDNPPAINPGRIPCSDCSLYNNLFVSDATAAEVFGAKSCDEYGSAGANIKNNFVYTPQDATPQLWSSCSSANGNSAAPYATNPGLVNPAGRDFSLSSSAAVAGKGIAAGAPLDDFVRNTRKVPPAIGAYDVAGGVAALQPPVLIQAIGN